MPIIDLTDEELAALTAAIRRLIAEDRFPRSGRLDPFRAALPKLTAAAPPRPLTAKSAKPAVPQPKIPKGRPRGA
jgi:hypothetical protein